jgi:hypothetical protein
LLPPPSARSPPASFNESRAIDFLELFHAFLMSEKTSASATGAGAARGGAGAGKDKREAKARARKPLPCAHEGDSRREAVHVLDV